MLGRATHQGGPPIRLSSYFERVPPRDLGSLLLDPSRHASHDIGNIRLVNPTRDPEHNCELCAIATRETAQGRPTRVTAGARRISALELHAVERRMFPESRWQRGLARDQIESRLLASGVGAGGLVGATYRQEVADRFYAGSTRPEDRRRFAAVGPGHLQLGHVFYAITRQNRRTGRSRVRFLDGQTGKPVRFLPTWEHSLDFLHTDDAWQPGSGAPSP
jgi:hypothetical protein